MGRKVQTQHVTPTDARVLHKGDSPRLVQVQYLVVMDVPPMLELVLHWLHLTEPVIVAGPDLGAVECGTQVTVHQVQVSLGAWSKETSVALVLKARLVQ